jgi:hypothetical protein
MIVEFGFVFILFSIMMLTIWYGTTIIYNTNNDNPDNKNYKYYTSNYLSSDDTTVTPSPKIILNPKPHIISNIELNKQAIASASAKKTNYPSIVLNPSNGSLSISSDKPLQKPTVARSELPTDRVVNNKKEYQNQLNELAYASNLVKYTLPTYEIYREQDYNINTDLDPVRFNNIEIMSSIMNN